MNIKKNDSFTVEITGITSEGSGVARIDNFAIFIPETAIGDVVNIKIVKLQKSYGFGRVESIITPSVYRIHPECTCYTRCGGCVYRHITYEAELTVKQDLVQQSFARIGGVEIECDPIIGSEQVEKYRNKAQYPVAQTAENGIACGFYAKRSHRVVNCEKCKLQPDDMEEIRAFIVNFFKTHTIVPYDEVTFSGEVRHVYLRKAESTGEMMVCIVVNKRLSHSDLLVSALTDKFECIKSIVLNVNNENTNVILGNKCVTLYGSDYITDFICGLEVQISALSFYQVNRTQAELLYNKSINLAQLTKEDIVVDLYCGTGTIGLVCASQVAHVIGVEIIPQAIENAKINAKINNIHNISFICADAGTAAQKLAADSVAPTAIIVDPPRKGLDSHVVDAIVRMSPSRVVMISCNPTTAARDAKLLCESGYTVEKIIPVDMFPRTAHVECVCLLTRNR